jgi:hypothetical protein
MSETGKTGEELDELDELEGPEEEMKGEATASKESLEKEHPSFPPPLGERAQQDED